MAIFNKNTLTQVSGFDNPIIAGELEIQLYRDYKVDMKKGQLIAFPSMLQHRVIPIISGIRNSAVIWLNGPRMR